MMLNNSHFNKFSKCVDTTHPFIIQLRWIENIYNSITTSKSDIITPTTNFNRNTTPRINKIKVQLLITSDSRTNCNLTNDLDLLLDIHERHDNVLGTWNKNDVSNIISNKAGYI